MGGESIGRVTSDERLPGFLAYLLTVLPGHSICYFGGSDPGETDLGIRVRCFIQGPGERGCVPNPVTGLNRMLQRCPGFFFWEPSIHCGGGKCCDSGDRYRYR